MSEDTWYCEELNKNITGNIEETHPSCPLLGNIEQDDIAPCYGCMHCILIKDAEECEE